MLFWVDHTAGLVINITRSASYFANLNDRILLCANFNLSFEFTNGIHFFQEKYMTNFYQEWKITLAFSKVQK